MRQIEGKVIEISRLQEVFAEKVLQQVGAQVHAYDCNKCIILLRGTCCLG